MTRPARAQRGSFISRAALAAALTFGIVAGTAVVAPDAAIAAKKPKLKLSKGFIAAAQPAQEAVNALAEGDAAAAAAAKAVIDQALAAVENDDDRLLAGQLMLNLGTKSRNAEYQRAGIKMMLDSGKSDPASQPQLYAAAGQLALQAKDYAEAERYLQSAIAANPSDQSLKVLLSETYMANKQAPKGVSLLKSAIASSKASGTPAPESWYRRGLGAAYNAGIANDAAELGGMLMRDYPTSENAGLAVTIVRELGNYGAQETLDLMRLMGHTNSYNETRDYVDYIQAADPRRLPGEVIEVVNAGLAAGKLSTSDTFVSDARSQATGRMAADKASLPSYESDARKSGANEATVSGAADALLSYGKAAQAEELYKIALTKPGVDTNRTLTRLGIAQVEQGKNADAQATFGKVTGTRAPIATLWAAYAAGKAAPAAPAAATP